MTTVKTSSLGFPRIGLNREWKKSLEAYWKGKTDRETFLNEMDEQFIAALKTQLDQQIDIIPVSDFTFYDHVLDTAVMFNWIPERFKHVNDPLDTYFAMARGTKEAVSCEMTKWFNTNYHYIVPEYEKDAQFRLTKNQPLEDYRRAKEALGIETKPVILGLYTFVTLAKGYEKQDIQDIYQGMIPLYIQVLKELEQEGVKWVQIDEPALVTASPDEVAAAKEIYQTIRAEVAGPNVLLQTYFDSVDGYKELISFPVEGIGLDFVHDKGKNLEQLKAHGFPQDKVLAAGILDGRNIWKANLEERLDWITELIGGLGATEVWIQPSNSLLHVPVAKHPDEQLADDLLNGLSFAKEKLLELNLLKQGLVSGKAAVRAEINEAAGHLQALKQFGTAADTAFAEERNSLTRDDFSRPTPFEERLRIQNESLGLLGSADYDDRKLPANR